MSCHPCPELPSAFAGKAKRESGPKEEKRKRDVPAQPAKAAKPTSGGKSQQPPAPHPPPQVQPAGFSAHKEIKLTLLNKAADKNSSRKRYEPSDKDRQASPPAKRINLSPGSVHCPLSLRVPARSQASRAECLSRSLPLPPAKSGKSSTLSRREELLKQLKAVEDAIARKRAKIPGKV
ncbi:hypothetical protein Chor_004883 [Crotalus horridus]